MTEESTPVWQTTLHVALLAPEADPDAEPGLLVVPEGDGWALPRVVVPERIWFPNCPPILAAIREQLGVEAIILRRAAGRIDRERHEVDGLYLVEPRAGAWAPPPGARIVDRAALAALRLEPPAWPGALSEGLAALTWTAPTPDPAPWTRRGWFATVSTWIDERLAQRGRSIVEPIEQRAHSGISSVWRVPTDDGAVYFKTIPPAGEILFANEPELIATLAARFPDRVPTPLAIDAERRWLLLADVGEQLAMLKERDLWEEAIRTVAQLQIASIGQVEALLEHGCLDRRLETLPDRIAPLLEDPLSLEAIDAAELARLRALAPRLRATIAALAAVGLPPTLVHGDFHAGNVAVRDGQLTLFDWTDACVAHPFVDLALLPEEAAQILAAPEATDRLREVYLGEWTAFAPIERLREAAALAAPMIALHHAISYRHLVAGVEPAARLEVVGGLSWSLRALLACLEEPAASNG